MGLWFLELSDPVESGYYWRYFCKYLPDNCHYRDYPGGINQASGMVCDMTDGVFAGKNRQTET